VPNAQTDFQLSICEFSGSQGFLEALKSIFWASSPFMPFSRTLPSRLKGDIPLVQALGFRPLSHLPLSCLYETVVVLSSFFRMSSEGQAVDHGLPKWLLNLIQALENCYQRKFHEKTPEVDEFNCVCNFSAADTLANVHTLYIMYTVVVPHTSISSDQCYTMCNHVYTHPHTSSTWLYQ
jgi:hypothetical protein